VRSPIFASGDLTGLFGITLEGAGALGEAQKHPGDLSPHLGASVQQEPPVCVLQQHSVAANFVPGEADVGVVAAAPCEVKHAAMSSASATARVPPLCMEI
jgi:hypothetical protein